GAGLAGQLLAKVLRGDLVRLEQPLAQARIPSRVVRRLAFRLGNRQSELPGEQPDGVLEADLFVQLEELENVAARLAPEAVKEPFLRIDVKRGRLLRMKRTESLERAAGSLQRDVLLDHLHDVRLQADVVDEALGEQAHG